MSFLAPLFLIGVVAGIIPVVLHMINRRRAKEMPFATLRFLQLSIEQTRRRKRIHNLLLLMLRIAALVFLAFALARPALTDLSRLWSDRAETALVIVLDNSATMGTSDGTTTRWEKGRDAAGAILRELHDGDAAALILTGGRPYPTAARFDYSQETVRQLLAEATLSYEKADLGAALAHARALLAGVDAANKSIFLITDRQAASWPELEKGAEPESEKVAEEVTVDAPIPVVVVDCRSEAKAPNVAVSDVQTTTTVPIARFPFIVTAELFNTSDTTVRRHAELYLDGILRETSPAIEISPGERVRHAFTLKVAESGEHRGKIRLAGDDALKFDDERFFALSVDREIPVAIVQTKPHEIDYLDDTFYLSTALGARKGNAEDMSLGIRATKIDLAELAGEPLEPYRVVFCVNLSALDHEAAKRLAEYVARGGNLMWIAGNRVEPADYNRMNEATGGQLLPGILTTVHDADTDPDHDSWYLNELSKESPVTSHFADTPSIFRKVLVYRHVGIAGEGMIPLARLDNGEVLLAEREVEAGNVWWLGTSVHVDWTNLPLRTIFMPFWVQFVHSLSGSDSHAKSIIAGRPLSFPLNQEAIADQVELRRPSGDLLRLSLDEKLAERRSAAKPPSSSKTFFYDDTYQIGIYTMRPVGVSAETRRIFCVNLDAAELDDASLEKEDLQKQIGQAPLMLITAADSPAKTFKLLRSGVGLWQWFLMAVLAVLVFETYWSNRHNPHTP